MANKMKGKLEPSERQRLIEEGGALGANFRPTGFPLFFKKIIIIS